MQVCLRTPRCRFEILRAHETVLLQGQLVGADDRNNYDEMQVNNCSMLTVRFDPLSIAADFQLMREFCRV